MTCCNGKPESKFIVFQCADALKPSLDGTGQYYERSIWWSVAGAAIGRIAAAKGARGFEDYGPGRGRITPIDMAVPVWF